MPVVALIVTSITSICVSITVIINFDLLYNVFVSKKWEKSPRLALFYFRFGVDGFLGLAHIIIMFFMFLKLLGIEYIVTSHPYLVFSVIWPTANTVSIRTFLAVIINIDRTFAVFFPIFYRNHRISFNNYLLIFIASCYPILDNIMNWIVCDFKLIVPPGCVTFGCIGNKCFLRYSLAYEVANQLALIDALIIITFDVIPSFVLATVQVDIREFGSIMAFGKMTGLSLEAYIVYQTFKKKNEIVTNASLIHESVKGESPQEV
ncbi:hypothetical protein CAEBREN_23623 [Caenorhabditis brenneri]|uniref:Serpentine receptor class gamma n=1 Tax=Caenorhabditis brenneri TaxID=135651 RepID=G0NEH3_CAEBE|nr:hypothetical protein CAEBREN_23623 [Caenorhabditis brenneri]